MAPLTGLVETMNGLIPIVVKLHGFGFGPGRSGFPAVSLPAVTWTVYTWSSRKFAAWLIVRTVFVGEFHPKVVPMPGAIEYATVPMFIAWLNVTTMSAASGTFVDAFAGFVRTMTGFVQNEKNVHGFGMGPAVRASP